MTRTANAAVSISKPLPKCGNETITEGVATLCRFLYQFSIVTVMPFSSEMYAFSSSLARSIASSIPK